ncbi:MAG: hypothetical protein MUC47_05895 [Candidatus Kapabacteria bacterium]|jgi:hypothetical protein|nr:hypothetical protein [Candidatus Kapabacteria bacterium]
MTIFAWAVFVTCATAVLGFQIAVALGAPLGHLTQGGKHPGVLPRQGRLIAAVSAIIVSVFITAVSMKAYNLSSPSSFATIGTWVAVVYSVLAVPIHIITPSAAERRLWLPVIVVLLVSALTVAVSP